MKKNVIYLFILSAMFYGCAEDFLDPVRNTNVLTDVDFSENIDVNPALVEGTLEGISGFMIQPFGSLGNNAGRHYDIGQKGVDIWTDIVCGDAALSASAFGWYNGTANLQATTNFTDDENDIIWNYYFRIIGIANSVIQSSGGNNPESTDANVLRINAQAKAYRAYSYFYLAQLFQPGYDPNQPILPFYNIDDVNTAKVEASQIYDLIISDLLFAIDNLDGFARTNKSAIDKTVAQGLLAYTYAAMGNYPDAKIYSDAVIASGYPLTTAGALAFPGAGSGFGNINSAPSWIWGFDITADLGHQLINWWGQMDYFTYSYAWAGDTKSIDDALFNQIPDTDIRKTQFGEGAAELQPINKFFDLGRAPGGQFAITTDYIFMRVEEFYLLSAEAAAKTGDEATAKARLQDLLNIRMGNAEATSYLAQFSGQSLIDEIYFQTRVEMWGEGKSYLAMKRNQATVTRGTNHVFRPGQSFSYDSDELSFQIPENEIINNPNISSQNN